MTHTIEYYPSPIQRVLSFAYIYRALYLGLEREQIVQGVSIKSRGGEYKSRGAEYHDPFRRCANHARLSPPTAAIPAWTFCSGSQISCHMDSHSVHKYSRGQICRISPSHPLEFLNPQSDSPFFSHRNNTSPSIKARDSQRPHQQTHQTPSSQQGAQRRCSPDIYTHSSYESPHIDSQPQAEPRFQYHCSIEQTRTQWASFGAEIHWSGQTVR